LAVVAVAADGRNSSAQSRRHVAGDGPVRDVDEEGTAVALVGQVGEGFAGPVVAGKRVVLFHRVGDEEVIECFRHRQGRVAVEIRLRHEVRGQVRQRRRPARDAVDFRRQGLHLRAEGVLTCVELESGKKVWQEPLRSKYKMRDNFSASARRR